MDYAEAVAALQARGRFGISLGLDRITRLLEVLGHPERGLRGSLVGGTNGKGSVVAMARSVLNAAGVRVGTMPKPHLVSYAERIAIDGRPVSEGAFADAVAAVLPELDRVGETLGPPTEFEALTAAAISALARSGIDLALIEVGMGGRLDATNALDLGVATITTVQHDHERYLGPTLAAIGREKAAIIKRGNLAVTGASGRGLHPIEDRCAEVGAPLRRAGRGQPYRTELLHAGWDGIVVRAHTPSATVEELRVGLLGGHQATNAATALALLDALGDDAARRGARWAVSEASLRAGMAAVRWPGRLELVDAGPPLGRVLLDGAHNPAGARTLAAALRELGLEGMPLVFGAMRGKRVSAMLRALLPLRPLAVFAAVEDGHAHGPGDLLHAWRRVGGEGGRVADDPRAAVELAATLRRGDEPVVIAGSLYLVGAIRGMLFGAQEA